MTDQVFAMLNTINNNFLSVMSMVIGVNCRLNSMEVLIREMHQKSFGNEGDRENSEMMKEEQEVDENDEEKFKADLGMMGQFVSTMLTLDEDPEIAKDVEKEVLAEVNEKEIICYDCKAVFRRGTGEFTRHLLNTRCRPYACSVCKKLFKKKSNMETHKLTHSELNMQCSECGAVFKCDQYLKNHQKRVHKMVFPADETDEQPSAKRRKTDNSASSAPTSSSPMLPTTSSASTPQQGHFDQASFDSFMSQIMMKKESVDRE